MPAIWNINQGYNTVNNKKLTSKLSFSQGEVFKGKIAEKTGEGEIKVKLSDGWQFSAEVEGDATFSEQDMVKFEVVGYENGKLKLKLLGSSEENVEVPRDTLKKLAQSEGLEENDVDILKKMVEYNIPLTRDNIKFVKSIIQFSQRVNNDPKEIDNFIDKYLESKNIDPNSEQAVQIRESLSQFINVFKNMESKDILFFLENNIEMTKENIDSYNKLFNSDINLKEHFEGLAQELKDMNLTPIHKNENTENIKTNLVSEEIVNEKISQTTNTVPNKNLFATKAYDSVEGANSKIDVLGILKSMVSDEIDAIKTELTNVLNERMSDLNITEYGEISFNIKNLMNDKIVDLIKNALNEEGKIDDTSIKTIVNNIFGKEIKLSDGEINNLIEVFKPIIDKSMLEESADISNKNTVNINNNNINNDGISKSVGNEILNELGKLDVNNKEVVDNSSIINKHMNKDSIKNELIDKGVSIKESVKDIIKIIEDNGVENSKIVQFLKENINDFKLFNEVNKEYYYLDVPVNQNGKEYQCKLVIKDKRKDGKQIDKSNVKVVVSVNTINLGKIDNYLTIRGNLLNVDIRCNEEMVKILDKNKDQLVKALSNIGLVSTVSVSKKVEEVSLTSCREFFNESKLSIIDRIV